MKTSSAKAKGRALCKHIKDRILFWFPYIEDNDIIVTSSGTNGEDLQFSPKARASLPISIEGKSHARYAIYKDYEQAKSNAKTYEPILVVKQNNSKPLAIMDLDYFLEVSHEAKV